MNINGIEIRSDFGDPMGEARACRNDCAVFDFSFIASACVIGKGAEAVVEKFASRSLVSLANNRIAYALRVDEHGQAISDLTIWKNGPDSFDIMSGRSEDIDALRSLTNGDLLVRDITEESIVFAVQGPFSLDALYALGIGDEVRGLKYFSFRDCTIGGIPCRVGRLGYTGEAGFEIIVMREDARKLWKLLSAQARPAGFIAADALRIEAGFVLFTNEFRLPVFPIEAGLGKFHLGNGKFKSKIKLVTFTAHNGELRPLPWKPAEVLARPKPGEIVITSACRSSSDRRVIGLGYVLSETPQDVELSDPRGVFRNISQAHTPIYDGQKLRPRVAW